MTIYGGSGFLGRHVVRALAKRGYRIRVAVRRPDLALFLQPLGKVNQIVAVQANLRYPDSVVRAAERSDVLINLVGILQETGSQSFARLQVDGAEAIARAAARQGARTVLVDPAPRVGGMCSGGLGHTDRGNSIVIGGFAQEFFEHNRQHYHANETVGGKPGTVCHGDTHGTDIGCGFYLEPHVAEGVFVQMLADAKVQHVRSNGSQVASVAKQGTVLKSLTLEDGTTFAGKVFIVSQRETLRLITASSPPLRTSSSV